MILVQITDTHISLDDERGHARVRDLEACVADINTLVPKPDAVIHTGDIAHNGAAAEYDCAAGILSGLSARLHVTAGNRDNRSRLREAFSGLCGLQPDGGFLHYEGALPGLRLIALDSVSGKSNKGEFCETRLAWLDAALGENTNLPVALFAHHAPINVINAQDPIQYESMEMVSRLTDILGRYAHVKALFCGHSHRAAQGKIAHVPVSTAPSVAANLRRGIDRAKYPDGPIYQIHRLYAQGRFETELRAVAVAPLRQKAI